MVNGDQPHDLSHKHKTKADRVRIIVALWCGYVTIVDVELQQIVHDLRWVYLALCN